MVYLSVTEKIKFKFRQYKICIRIQCKTEKEGILGGKSTYVPYFLNLIEDQ